MTNTNERRITRNLETGERKSTDPTHTHNIHYPRLVKVRSDGFSIRTHHT